MLFKVRGWMSSFGLPATVTRPRLTGCFSCRWLPRITTISQPSTLSCLHAGHDTSRPASLLGGPHDSNGIIPGIDTEKLQTALASTRSRDLREGAEDRGEAQRGDPAVPPLRNDERAGGAARAPGGPFWARRDAGAWSIPKGEVDPGEEERDCALRELEEETGAAFADVGRGRAAAARRGASEEREGRERVGARRRPRRGRDREHRRSSSNGRRARAARRPSPRWTARAGSRCRPRARSCCRRRRRSSTGSRATIG